MNKLVVGMLTGVLIALGMVLAVGAEDEQSQSEPKIPGAVLVPAEGPTKVVASSVRTNVAWKTFMPDCYRFGRTFMCRQKDAKLTLAYHVLPEDWTRVDVWVEDSKGNPSEMIGVFYTKQEWANKAIDSDKK